MGKFVDSQVDFAIALSNLVIYGNSIPGYQVTIGEVERPKELQEIYVARGSSWTMNSEHLNRRAGDLHIYINGVHQDNAEAYKPLADKWKACGGKWGVIKDGKQVDPYHFEWVEGMKWKESIV
jgi:hypothetical protein